MDFLSLLGDDAPSVGVGGAGSGDAPNPGVAAAGSFDFLSLLGDDAPRVGVGGAETGDAPNPGVASAGEALAIPTSAPVALSPGLRLSASVKPKAKQRFGSGRHGSRLERAPCLRTYVLRIYVVRMHVDTQTDAQTDT